MSRIGKLPIPIPEGVEIRNDEGMVRVKGPRGTLERPLPSGVHMSMDGGAAVLGIRGDKRQDHALHGLARVLVSNMVTGVSKGFEKVLEIVGVGYRAEVSGRNLILYLGYSHPIEFALPEGVDARIEKSQIFLSGMSRELLGETAARIRRLRKPEPYKGKGVKYAGETIRRKAGKAGT